MTYKSENAHCFRQQYAATRLSAAQQLEHLTGELSWVLLWRDFDYFCTYSPLPASILNKPLNSFVCHLLLVVV